MRFSIITVNYNDAEGLKKTFDSVKSQSFTDYEHIVIDGGSSDGSVDIIREVSDELSFWQSKADRGTYDAMNIGLKMAKGEYVNFMNSGDIFHSSEILKVVNEKLDDFDIVTGNSSMPEINKAYINPYKKITLLTLLKHPLSHQSIFYKKDIFNNHCYDINLKMLADFKLNLQSIIFDNCSVKIVDDIISDFDVHGISSENPSLYNCELQKILSDFFPPRVIDDYRSMITPEEIKLIELMPQLRNTSRLQAIAYQLVRFLLKLAR